MLTVSVKKTIYNVRLISLKQKNPENVPDDFEIMVLKNMQKQKLKEVFYSETLDTSERKILRYLAPIYVKEQCLQCHGEPVGKMSISGHKKDGYKLGDLLGAVSVIAPLEPINASLKKKFNSAYQYCIVFYRGNYLYNLYID